MRVLSNICAWAPTIVLLVGFKYFCPEQTIGEFYNTDVMRLADYIIDVGPDGGTNGGRIVFTGTPEEMIRNGDTITAKYLWKSKE